MAAALNKHKWLSVSLVLLLIALLAGCAAKKQLWGNVKSGLILEYRMPESKSLHYHLSNDMTQDMEVMGQPMQNVIDLDIHFSTTATPTHEGNFNLQITIDSSSTSMKTQQGDMSPDLGHIAGKQLQMLLSPLGEELALDGVDVLSYTMGGGERNLSSNFQAIFPNLAGKPVKLGDSWTTHDTIKVEEGDMSIRMIIDSEHTLAGLETVDGRECAKITAAGIGKLDGTGSQQGADLVFDADIKSNDVWYFAYKNGVLVRTISEGTTEGTIQVSGPADISIPLSMKSNTEVKLLN